MRIFLSYASEDRAIAEEISLALAGVGHEVFFDRDSLRSGEEYNSRIQAAIMAADVMIFLISSYSIGESSYTLTELKFAKEKWTHPKGRLLPIMVSKTDWNRIPIYVKAVTVLQPEGNVAAEALAAVSRLSLERTGLGSAIAKVSDNEIIYPGDIAMTLTDVAAALKKLGRITKTDQEKRFVEGKVRYGLQLVGLHISLTERDSLQTGIIIQGYSDDVWNAGGRSATRRLIETLTHLDTPGYRVDRLGFHPAVLFAVVCGFVLVLMFILMFIYRTFRFF
jgi:hypothetical protein